MGDNRLIKATIAAVVAGGLACGLCAGPVAAQSLRAWRASVVSKPQVLARGSDSQLGALCDGDRL